MFKLQNFIFSIYIIVSGFFSLNAVSLRFIVLCISVVYSILLLSNINCVIKHNWFIYSPVDGHLVSFQTEAIINEAVVHILIQVFIWVGQII